MLGNNFPTHKCVPEREYMSYKIVGQKSVASMFAKQTQVDPESNAATDNTVISEGGNVPESTITQDDDLGNEMNGTQDDELGNEMDTQEEVPLPKQSGEKRYHQQTIFESLGKLNEFERTIGKIIADIEDPTQLDYLQKIKETMEELKRASVEIRHYRDRKKKRLQEIESLRNTIEMSIEDQTRLKQVILEKDAKILSLKSE